MKILCVVDEYPWPSRSGYRQRLHWLLTLLSAHGELDLLVVGKRAESEQLAPPPADLALNRLLVVQGGQVTTHRLVRLARWILGRRPRALLGRDWSQAQTAAAGWSRTGYDVTWFSHSPLYLALGGILLAPHVVDLDNLESSSLQHRRLRRMRADSTSERLRQSVQRQLDKRDERRWRRLELLIARRAAATVVCSELDLARLNRPRTHVVPNGYEPTADELPARVQTPLPVLVMVGLLTYEPNRDAAAFFAREVLPRVRHSVPDARFRVVGRYGSEHDVQALRGLPGVEVVGEVDAVTAELSAAAVAVAPIRFGGGTRIKILEAMAHGLAVVTTTVGCEGLETVPGRHLIVGDTAEEMAAGCVALLVDDQLRAEVGDAGRDLWQRRYRWRAMDAAVTEVLRSASREG